MQPMKQIINKSFTMECAHQLVGVPTDHKCSRLHGHTYRVTIELSGSINSADGMMVDFGLIKQAIHGRFDHRYLNDEFEAIGMSIPTSAENFCHVIATILESTILRKVNLHVEPSERVVLELVRVQEGEGGIAELRRTV